MSRTWWPFIAGLLTGAAAVCAAAELIYRRRQRKVARRVEELRRDLKSPPRTHGPKNIVNIQPGYAPTLDPRIFRDFWRRSL